MFVSGAVPRCTRSEVAGESVNGQLLRVEHRTRPFELLNEPLQQALKHEWTVGIV
jgi:hypothetical protein